ncbi:THAP domain-containing protein 2 [Argiope bruennichi]|uniref:THAP domain-containing protein 2 n=1 Tax=Argiope bruennichi TaxID=94029 RepID=A0A8T0EJ59_ARGBR|nr:THAP domain-containing protein 2 [Argiope bruennichi]
MPYKCSVQACRGNYNEENKVAVFGYPTDEALRKKWLSAIPRKSSTITKNSKVCERHFKDGEVLYRTTIYKESTGETFSAPLKKPRLKENAVPSIFPGCPTYLSSSTSSIRESPSKKRQRLEQAQIERSIIESLNSKQNYDNCLLIMAGCNERKSVSSNENELYADYFEAEDKRTMEFMQDDRKQQKEICFLK